MSITKKFFGKMPDGRDVDAYTLKKGGVELTVLSLGGIVNQLLTPDKDGRPDDIVCGFDTVEGYLTGGGYQGALIGRYGNRIAGGKFTLDGKEYVLFNNEKGICHLHGGKEGFNVKIWNVEPVESEESDSLILTHFSPDGDEGYPGNLSVKVTYTLASDASLSIRYEADSDKNTIFNPTNHTYYNLKGFRGASVMDTYLELACDKYNDVDEQLIPAGAPKDVAGTPFDFRKMKEIGQGFDHNFIRMEKGFGKTAYAYEKTTGRTLTLYTDMPGVQLYTAVCMDGDVPFKGGLPQRPLHAFCLETQYAPNTPNRPDFPSCELKAGEHFDSTTKLVFGVKA